MKREFNLGDTVWTLQPIERHTEIICPDCCGNKYLTVTMGDGSQETIDCSLCSVGWNGPSGKLFKSIPGWFEVQAVITRKEQKAGDSIEYGCDTYYHCRHIYATKEEATVAIAQVIADREAEFAADLKRKERPKASWAWNVRYHREQIKDLTKRIEYHQAKLDVARLKSRDKEV